MNVDISDDHATHTEIDKWIDQNRTGNS